MYSYLTKAVLGCFIGLLISMSAAQAVDTISFEEVLRDQHYGKMTDAGIEKLGQGLVWVPEPTLPGAKGNAGGIDTASDTLLYIPDGAGYRPTVPYR